MATMRDWIRMRTTAIPRTIRFGFVDVRDVAAVCVGSLTGGEAPARHLLAGHINAMVDMLGMAAELTGRKVRVMGSPLWTITLGGIVCDLVSRTTGNQMPLTGETARITVGNARAGGLQNVDQTSATEAFGFPARTITETLTDTIRWMSTAGHLTPDQAGDLAS
jgi:nucleoside-diphosphate-sugar epimerase